MNEIDHKAEIDRHFAWFQSKLSPRWAGFVGWLRKPSSILVRIPLALLLVAGGVFSFLPVLGLWMLPLGLVLIAQDVPFLQKPMARMLGWIERKWIVRQKVMAAKNAAAKEVTKDSAREQNDATVTQMSVPFLFSVSFGRHGKFAFNESAV